MASEFRCREYRRRGVTLLVLIGALVVSADGAMAQGSDAEAEIVEAVRTVLAGMSGNTGEDRDWQTWNRLFLPEARLFNVVGVRPTGPEVVISGVPEWTVDTGLNLDGVGFIEEVVHSVTEHYAGIASVFLTYQTRRERGGEIRSRGAATFHLAKTEEGWRVASWMWTGEKEGVPLPLLR